MQQPLRSFTIHCGTRYGKGYAWMEHDLHTYTISARNSNDREALGILILELSCLCDLTEGVRLDLESAMPVPDWVIDECTAI